MISLATIVHDPAGKLLASAQNSRAGLMELYSESCFVVTKETDLRLIDLLDNWGKIQIRVKDGIGQPRRECVKMATAPHIHYCDFDRILYWFMAYPNELKNALDYLPYYDFTIFERTRRAFYTHPDFQRETERHANGLISKSFGGYTDFLTGSRGLSSRLKEVILRSVSGGAGVDAEWPLLVKKEDVRIGYLLCEGLEYESDYFGIRRQTREELLNRMDNLKEIMGVL